MDGWMHACMDGWMDAWMHGSMNGCMDGCMDAWRFNIIIAIGAMDAAMDHNV